jgi:hypothetical protein
MTVTATECTTADAYRVEGQGAESTCCILAQMWSSLNKSRVRAVHITVGSRARLMSNGGRRPIVVWFPSLPSSLLVSYFLLTSIIMCTEDTIYTSHYCTTRAIPSSKIKSDKTRHCCTPNHTKLHNTTVFYTSHSAEL